MSPVAGPAFRHWPVTPLLAPATIGWKRVWLRCEAAVWEVAGGFARVGRDRHTATVRMAPASLGRSHAMVAPPEECRAGGRRSRQVIYVFTPGVGAAWVARARRRRGSRRTTARPQLSQVRTWPVPAMEGTHSTQECPGHERGHARRVVTTVEIPGVARPLTGASGRTRIPHGGLRLNYQDVDRFKP